MFPSTEGNFSTLLWETESNVNANLSKGKQRNVSSNHSNGNLTKENESNVNANFPNENGINDNCSNVGQNGDGNLDVNYYGSAIQ